MSRPSSRGRLKAVAADFCQLINSPSTRKDNPVLPAMNARIFTPAPLVICALLATQSTGPAEIDSGGGKSSGGALNNHSSIGAAFATVPTQGGATVHHPGLIEVLYPITPASVTDVDGNGLPDGWEILHFGHLGVDSNADPDHDGTINLMEYLAGTNPHDAASVFRPQGNFTEGIFNMPILTTTGRNYQIWVSRDLENWTLQTTLTGDNTEQVFEFDETTVPPGPLHSDTHPSNYFFRVQILIP